MLFQLKNKLKIPIQKFISSDKIANNSQPCTVPSGGLTLIVGTQIWGFSCKVQRRPPADIFLNESLPPKTPLWTPCSWSPWSWFSREMSYKTLTLTLKICILQENGFKWAYIGLVWKLVLRATHSVLLYIWSDHLLEHSKAMHGSPKNAQMTLKDQSFVKKFKVLFVCIPEDVWPSKFGKCLKMPYR